MTLVEMKAAVYDLLAQRQALDMKLGELNSKIAEDLKKAETKDDPKT